MVVSQKGADLRFRTGELIVLKQFEDFVEGRAIRRDARSVLLRDDATADLQCPIAARMEWLAQITMEMGAVRYAETAVR